MNLSCLASILQINGFGSNYPYSYSDEKLSWPYFKYTDPVFYAYTNKRTTGASKNVRYRELADTLAVNS